MLYNRISRFIKDHLRNNFLYYFILFFLFILGNLAGPLIFKKLNLGSREYIFRIIYPKISRYNYQDLNYLSIFKNRMLFNIIMFLMLMCLSVFKYGFYLIPFIIFLKGILVSFGVSYLVNYHGFKGFITAIITLYPHWAFFTLPIVGFSALSMDIARRYNHQQYKGLSRIADAYLNENIIITIFYLILFIIASVIESYGLYIMILTLKDNI